MGETEKTAARRRARALLRSLGPEESLRAGAAAARSLAAEPFFREAEVVLVFLSMPGEIDTTELASAALGAGKTCAAARIDPDPAGGPGDLSFVPMDGAVPDWPRDALGIPSPPAEAPALPLPALGKRRVLVAAPGLAFDPRGGRLGRGKGYYDRFLRALRAAVAEGGGRVTVAGFCLEAQLVAAVPRGEGDEDVDYLATERGARAAIH